MSKIAIFLLFNIKLIMHSVSLATYLLTLNILKQTTNAPGSLTSELVCFFMMYIFLEFFYLFTIKSKVENLKEIIRSNRLK